MSPDTVVSSAERDELVRLRRDFHRHPELGYEEKRTSSIVARHLEELGYEVRTGVAETGVIASRAGSSGPALLIRADMDALPIQELTDVEYRSENEGVMHACGHDAHTAIGMVAASRFARGDLFDLAVDGVPGIGRALGPPPFDQGVDLARAAQRTDEALARAQDVHERVRVGIVGDPLDQREIDGRLLAGLEQLAR